MLNAFRRLIFRSTGAADTTALAQWAEQQGYQFLKARHAAGCIVEGRLVEREWRLEWGAPQRDYINGMELRLMADIQLHKELVAMVLNQNLAELMEKRVYDSYVDDVQTRVETKTPPEMRWLVMYPKLPSSDLGVLRERFTAACSTNLWLQQWLASPLGAALSASQALSDADQPIVLSLSRGRLVLRLAMPEVDATRIAHWFAVFESALREAVGLGVASKVAVAALAG